MFCKKCGTNLNDNDAFCPACGTAVNEDRSQTQYVNDFQPNNSVNATSALPMNWFKFLIYFSLFAGAVISVINGITLFTGAHYDGAAELVYAFFDGIKSLDTIIAVLSFVVAALAIYTRFRLSGYRKNGPMMLTVVYVIDAAINIIYIIGLSSILPAEVVEEMNLASYGTSIAVSIAMIFVNIVYFKKRAAMFTK